MQDKKIYQLVLSFVGVVAVLLGMIGVFLPLLPTTPFLLLASACFIKSSPRLHQKLYQNKYLGSILYEWETHRRIPKKSKYISIIVVMISFIASIIWVSSVYLKIALFCGMLLLIGYLCYLARD